MERLLSLSSAYWRQYLSSDDSSSDSAFPRTSDRTPIAISGHVFNSPSTPELMPSNCCADWLIVVIII